MSYWEGNGKHQALVTQLEEKMPSYGYTSNVFMNCFITMSHLYYDVFNNGAGNIEDCYAKDFERNVSPYLPSIDLNDFISCNDVRVEQHMDQALEYLKDKPMDFPVYTVWCNFDIHAVSRVSPIDNENWHPITFGMTEELERWFTGRINSTGDRDVTAEIEGDKRFQLPDVCYTILESTGQLIHIIKGKEGYGIPAWNTDSAEENRKLADLFNEQLGITPAQKQAMEVGSMFGWNTPGADPRTYEKMSLQKKIDGAEARTSAPSGTRSVESHEQTH